MGKEEEESRASCVVRRVLRVVSKLLPCPTGHAVVCPSPSACPPGPLPLSVLSQIPVFDDMTACPGPVWHSSREGVWCSAVAPVVNARQKVPMPRTSGRGRRRGMTAGTGAGLPAPRASLETSRGRQPSPRIRSVPVAVNAERSSPSSKTAPFTGGGLESSWMTSRSSSQSPSSVSSRMSSRIRWSVMCVRCKHTQPGSSSSGCRAPADRTQRTGQRRAGSRGSGMPSRAQPAGSTSWSICAGCCVADLVRLLPVAAGEKATVGVGCC
jgi:hypothetical protein